MRPSVCVFDWDGTLVDSTDFVLGAHRHVYKKLGFEEPRLEVLLDNMRHPTAVIYPQIFGVRSEEAIQILDAYIFENHISSLKVRAGAHDFLSDLVQKRIPVAVVSNKRHKFLVPEVEAAGFSEVFGDAIVGAGVAEKDKPYGDPVFFALDRLGISRDRVKNSWFFGDTITDLECAKSLGMRYINCAEDDWYCRDYFDQGGSDDSKFVSFAKITEKLICNF